MLQNQDRGGERLSVLEQFAILDKCLSEALTKKMRGKRDKIDE